MLFLNYSNLYIFCTKTYPILLFCGREGIKSVIKDLSYIFGASSTEDSGDILHNESGRNGQLDDSGNEIVHGRRRHGFRRRGDTTTVEGPTGAPPLGSSSMAGAGGGGPAAWAAAAFGRGDDRQVREITS